MAIRLTETDSQRKGKEENRVCDKTRRRVEIPAN